MRIAILAAAAVLTAATAQAQPAPTTPPAPAPAVAAPAATATTTLAAITATAMPVTTAPADSTIGQIIAKGMTMLLADMEFVFTFKPSGHDRSQAAHERGSTITLRLII